MKNRVLKIQEKITGDRKESVKVYFAIFATKWENKE